MFRNQRGSNWVDKALSFAIAATVGGAITGAALGALGTLLPPHIRTTIGFVLAAAAICLGVVEVSGRRLPILECDRETPQRWVHAGALHWATVNGVALGCGATTRIGFWSWYVVPVASVLFGDPLLGAVIYGAYGAARGAAVWAWLAVSAWHWHGSFDELAAGVLERQSIARRLGGVHLTVLGSTALGVLLH